MPRISTRTGPLPHSHFGGYKHAYSHEPSSTHIAESKLVAHLWSVQPLGMFTRGSVKCELVEQISGCPPPVVFKPCTYVQVAILESTGTHEPCVRRNPSSTTSACNKIFVDELNMQCLVSACVTVPLVYSVDVQLPVVSIVSLRGSQVHLPSGHIRDCLRCASDCPSDEASCSVALCIER